jgi:integrase
MRVYKLERCRSCNYKKRAPKPSQANGLCPTCDTKLYYSENYYFTYYLDGKKREKSAGPDKAMAIETESRMRIAIADGKAYVPMLWCNAVEELKKTYRGLSPKTVSMYENSLRHLTPFLGHLKLADITDKHLRDYKDSRMSKSISGATFNRERSTLKRIFTLSGIDWRFRKTVFGREKETCRDNFLDREQQSRLIKECKKTDYLYMAVLIGLDTGLRRSSLLSLKWTDIDFKNNLITKEGKSGKTHRVPITQRLRRSLRKYKLRQLSSIWIFPSPANAGKPISDISKSFKSACARADIQATLHDIRRTFGSFIIMSTKDISLAQELLGHSDITTTRKHYGHLLDSHLRKGIEQFEKNYG